MAEFFRSSTVWVIDFRFKGKARRWLRTFPETVDAEAAIAAELGQLYGTHAQLVEVRRAGNEEELQYLRGETPGNAWCPTGR